MARLASLPGTQAVVVMATRPLDPNPGFVATTSFTVDGQPKPAPGADWTSRIVPVSPSYSRHSEY